MLSLQGGYLHHVLVHAAKELHGVTLDTIEMTVKKGDDHKEATVVVDGEVKLRFATVRFTAPLWRQLVRG